MASKNKEEDICECGHSRWYHTKDKLNDGRCGCITYDFENRIKISKVCSCKKFKLRSSQKSSKTKGGKN